MAYNIILHLEDLLHTQLKKIHVFEAPKVQRINIEKEEVEKVSKIEVVKEANLILVEHIDFLGEDKLLGTVALLRYHILSMLLPKLLLMLLKLGECLGDLKLFQGPLKVKITCLCTLNFFLVLVQKI